MLIRTPDYYDKFKCIAGACTDTCCAGWQVDVDDASFEYYKSVPGAIGDRLRSVMIEGRKGAEGRFRIRDDGRCPFLNNENLCDLYAELGEDSLCVTCSMYPRYTCEFGNLRETGIALSCKTAAELILKDDRTPGFTEYNDDDAFPSLNNIDGLLFVNLMKAREKAFSIVRDRNYDIRDRMKRLLSFASDIQGCIKKTGTMKDIISRDVSLDRYGHTRADGGEKAKLYKRFWKYYLKQVIIKREWVELAELADKVLYNDNYERTERAFLRSYKNEEYECENILFYFVFRYFMKSVFDKDVLTKAKMAVISTMMIMQCFMALWGKNGRKLTFEERIEAAHLYSREVEHSEENFANLCKLFSCKKEFSTAKLIQLLSEGDM